MDRIGSTTKVRTLALSLMACALFISPPTYAGDTPERDSKALTALEQMGTYLRGLRYFRISASSETDQILEDGENIEFHHQTELQAVQPDKLQVSVEAQGSQRSFFYNGKTFTLYDSRTGYFARDEAPASIDELVDQLQDRYGIELPLTDLFRWDATTAQDVGITGALFIGNEVMAGQTCTHYAYRQPDIDWQLWIRQGDKPLPCRIVISRRDANPQPRHSVSFHWDLSKPSATKTFEFDPPAGARAVPLQTLDPSAAVQGDKP